MKLPSAVRLALVVLASISCGPGDERPAAGPAPGEPGTPAVPRAPAPPVREPGPPEAVLDDETVLALVLDAAKSGTPLPASLAKLPPRVSPVRVAVRAVHDHLLGVSPVPPEWPAILAALEDLAKPGRTDVDRGALAPLVAAWRGWTAADRETEHALAVRYTRGLTLVGAAGGLDVRALAVAVAGDVPRAPAKSPAGAALAALRALYEALAAPGDDVPPAFTAALDSARTAFSDLGWAGGLGPFAEAGAARLLRGAAETMRTHTLLDAAFAAYRESGDALRAALVTYDRIGAAERANDVPRALKLARTAVEQIRATGARGSELTDALFRAAQLALAAGKPGDAAPWLAAALDEIAYAKLDPAQRAPVQERHATALWLMGRHAEAVAAAADGARAYDENVRSPAPEEERLRASLDEIRGRAAADAGDFRTAEEAFAAAAKRHARLPGGDSAAQTARLFRASAFGRAGQREAAVLVVLDVIGSPDVSTVTRAHAASVLREVGALDEAQIVLATAIDGADPELREMLAEEIARLAAAAHRWSDARNAFATAVERLAKEQPGPAVGRVLLDFARMELDAGDLDEAARLASAAIAELAESPRASELDDARQVWVIVQRRAGGFRSAERVVSDRIAAGADAWLDLALVRMELAALGQDGAKPALEQAVAGLAKSRPWAAAAIAKLGLGRDDVDWANVTTANAASEREVLLLHAVDRLDAELPRLLEFARAVPATEPELRRWALRRILALPASEHLGLDWIEWLDLWAGAPGGASVQTALLAALGSTGRFVGVQWTGSVSVVVVATGGTVVATIETSDLGLREAWEAVFVDPAPAKVAAAMRRLTAGLAPAMVAAGASGGEPVVLCVGAPYGGLPEEFFHAIEGGAPFDSRARGDFLVVSPAEFVAAAARPAPPALSMVRSPGAPLPTRFAVAPLVPPSDATRARFAELISAARKRGLDPRAALAEAKTALRGEWIADPARPALPPWMGFAMRGAP